MESKRNQGFGERIFLTKEEWQTYCRRKPVRYIKKAKDNLCCVCGECATTQNPFQNAHIIGFDVGIIDLGLTPDFLDSAENIKTAHRNVCNKKAECSLQDALNILKAKGVQDLPSYLSENIKNLWLALKNKF